MCCHILHNLAGGDCQYDRLYDQTASLKHNCNQPPKPHPKTNLGSLHLANLDILHLQHDHGVLRKSQQTRYLRRDFGVEFGID